MCTYTKVYERTHFVHCILKPWPGTCGSVPWYVCILIWSTSVLQSPVCAASAGTTLRYANHLQLLTPYSPIHPKDAHRVPIQSWSSVPPDLPPAPSLCVRQDTGGALYGQPSNCTFSLTNLKGTNECKDWTK